MIKPIFKRTKILATIGPATESKEMIQKLLLAGVNGCRLNFSHGENEQKLEKIKLIRQASADIGKPVAIVQDLQGPKIRLGKFNNDQFMTVTKGQELILDYDKENTEAIPVQYNLAEKVKVGQKLYLFDGRVRSEIIEIVSKTAIKIRIENNGQIMSRKGINLPDTDFGGDIITKKDLRDIEFGAGQDFDFVALSFVQSAADIQNLRQILLSHGSDAQIIAKIETKQAISEQNLEKIIEETDGVMVARGDLAIEVGAEVVPAAQDKIIELCRKHGKLVIVATQMLASMTDSPQPTRAEASDIANAVMQGADAVMLSEETAMGNYPLHAVIAMKKIILYTQNHTKPHYYESDIKRRPNEINAISQAAAEIAEQIDAQAIIVETTSGASAARVASVRPNRVILSVSTSARTAQQLALSYANQSYLRPMSSEAGFELAEQLKRASRFDLNKLVKVVIVSGRQKGVIGSTDTIQVRTV